MAKPRGRPQATVEELTPQETPTPTTTEPRLPETLETLRPLLGELERYAVWVSEGTHDYEIELVGKTVITIQPKGPRKSLLGHFAKERWSTKEGDAVHEIALAAEELRRPTLDILCTLHHELVHCYAYGHGVQDCSKSGRHNFKFKALAEGFGLKVEMASASKGWAYTELSEELAKVVTSEFIPQEEAFRLFRLMPPLKDTPPSKLKKWSCSCIPPVNVRVAVQLDAVCQVCELPFVQAEE